MSKNIWNDIEKTKTMEFSKGYIKYLDLSKTERLCTKYSIKLAKEAGFIEYDKNIKLKEGDKVYLVNRDKSVIFAHIGKDDILNGINIVASHIDSPRLDLKPNPLYEDLELAMVKTHYYGGIKKYQWTSIPLSLIGTVVKQNGEKIDVSIGEGEDESVFTVTDLLPHLAADQMKKTMSEAFTGEDLNALFGSLPSDNEEESVKDNIIKLIKEKYDFEEEDFVSAELMLVPAFKAKNVGLDSSFVGAYGQDDRVCAYTSLKAILDLKNPDKTSVCYLADKEEIGSMGSTGTKSRFFETFIAHLIKSQKGDYNELYLKDTFANSKCLSCDVTVGYDPNYKSVCEANNSAYMGAGICICKYTGARGKSGTSDANAEFVAEVRKIFNKNNVKWQIAELGKVDQGGGGTVAQYIANLNIETLDCGVPILSMHAPFEIASKADIYMGYLAYKAFMEN
ncbi:MAG: aminopeptidase [Ruminococcaceae bacterium]|nr:aminopeptidase [Oscillospiraceae bacterium]